MMDGFDLIDSDFDADLDTWIKFYFENVLEEPMTDFGTSVDDMTINPNYPSQSLMEILDTDTYFGEGSSNASQFGMTREMMQSSNITFNSSNAGTLHGSGQILSSAVKTLSNHAAQSSQNLPNITFDDQMRQFHYQTPSVQQQQNPNQNQFQLQQVTGTSGDLISVIRQQQVRKMRAILSAPVGFKTLDEFPSRDTYREYLFRQIRMMKVTYYTELQKIYCKASQRHAQAATADDKYMLGKNASYLEKMLRFLNITSVDLVPEDDKRVYEYMNIIVNYMAFITKAKPGGFFQHHVPVHQSPNGPSVQPLNPSQRATNQETNMVNFNQGFTSRRPQTEQSGMTSSSNITCFPIGLGSPMNVFSNAAATNLPFHQVNHQLPQMFNSEKMKQPMRKTNEFRKPKIRSGRSPLISSFDINGVVSSSSSRRGRSPLTTVETQKHTEPTGTRFRGPQTSEDAVHHLTQVVKPVSSKKLSSSLTDIGLMEKAANIIPDCMPTNLVGNVNNKPHSKTRRELSVGPPEWDIYPTETSFNKKQKIENKWTLLEEIKEVNSILLETTIHAVLDPSEDNITILGDYEGIKLKCLFRNICFPDLLSPYGSISSEKMPEFGVLFIVPFDYPASTTRIFRSGQNALKSEPWGTLYEDMLTRFDVSIREVRGILCVGELAKMWDASAHAVMTEFIRKLGGENFGLTYGTWESCISSSSGSN
ncbi:hypothetical protein HanIR_Chr04g0203021 [Helianthus annuus]|nr:hypothetical protein HanIR_Chr04g0203021 [Helianthus annuus]